MGKKVGNSKADAAKEKKAAAKNEKDNAVTAKKEQEEAEKWSDGAKGKGKKEVEAEKKASLAAKKAEAAKLLAEEEKSIKSAKVKDKPTKSASKPNIPEFEARNLDDALDLLSLDSGGNSAKDVEKHPERRFKAAFAAYEERELPIVKKDYPGLRLQQYKDMIYKNFQKSPENPFNQASVNYNATKDDIKDLKDQKRKQVEGRLRVSGEE